MGRFDRQVRFAPIGVRGQERIGAATVALVGVGALGTHLADMLVRAGVGRLALIDRDVVELTNLQRQILFDERDAARGTPKAIAAAERLAAINSSTLLHPVVGDFSVELWEQLVADLGVPPDLLLDGTDNFAARYLLNDLAVRAGIPWIYGGVVASTGRAMVVLPGITPCLRCLLPQPPPAAQLATCETDGILAPVIAAVTAFQGAETLKLLSGNTAAVTRGVLSVDIWSGRYTVHLSQSHPSADCPCCTGNRFPAIEEPPRAVALLCGRDAVQVQPHHKPALDLVLLHTRLATLATDLHLTPYLLRFTIDSTRFSVFPDGRALLFGLHDTARATILYDRYIGPT